MPAQPSPVPNPNLASHFSQGFTMPKKRASNDFSPKNQKPLPYLTQLRYRKAILAELNKKTEQVMSILPIE